MKRYPAGYAQQLEELEQAIKADANLEPCVERLVAIKGRGLVSVAVLIAKANNFGGFANHQQLVSYAGCDVAENQSRHHRGRVKISKKGNSRLSSDPAYARFHGGSLWLTHLQGSV